MPRAIAPEVTTTTSTPTPCSAATSSQMRSSTPGRRSPDASATTEDPSLTTAVGISSLRLGGGERRGRGRHGLALEPVEPQRERHETPELARVVLAACDVLVDEALDRRGLEAALAAQALGPEHLAAERLELAAQPGGRGDREALLAPAGDLAADERLDRRAQQSLL